ncbi:DUF58 domain-containing protein [Meiothermus taiwanensis]|uniref:DUF58 domain-containing protein n=2 Tax=Meiothermus taiwanensis TaxID=172827 RepID=A0A399DWB6_9DEIN|nr:DUF58 domain-containing protein [Meiothermus taiwanensis]AWR86903.1 hypothetical protein Mtai_v1c16640 [Meiothermus taiwanensis WR-220]KIQ55191.1 hypothetical protein SY28_04815 [Meiothermus taiwanensis]KZK15821.1 hypothetical protein A3962_08730 [Meiothermus taiwanensis]RIH74200.1 hypothetical protein Mcate_02805 [Meiothermus taiwanensis]
MLLRRPRKSQIEVTLEAEPKAAPPRPRELPAELLRRLEFRVLKRLDGFLFGDYTGFFYGPSLDLAEVREYQPGDEVRRIDWNVTARTGKIHIRQYREEKEVTVWLVVDLSASMRFGTRRVLKLEEALEFVGTAAAIVGRHGDKVGAIGFSEAGMRMIPPGTGRRQALRILHELYRLMALQGGAVPASKPRSQPGQAGSLEEALEHAAKTLRRRALLFVVSDFLSQSPAQEPPWAQGLRRLAYRHDVVAVRIFDPAEKELPNVGELRLRDLESGEEIWIDTSDPRVRRAHAALVQARETMLERTLRAAQVDVLHLSTAQEIVEPLLKFTLRRRGRR